MNFSTLCTILVTLGLETPEFMLLTVSPFAAIRQKSAYHVKISECPGPILTYFIGFVGIPMGMIISIFVWRSSKGRCYGNQFVHSFVRSVGSLATCLQPPPALRPRPGPMCIPSNAGACTVYFKSPAFGCRWSIWTSFSDMSMDVAMAANFVKKMANSPLSLLWHSEMEWDIATLMCALTA